MEVLDYIKRSLAMSDRIFGQITEGLTPETFHWRPSGHANRISALYLHVVSGQDRNFQLRFQSKPTLWESEWHNRLGLPREANWDAFNSSDFDLETALQYGQAVQAGSQVYLASLQEEELERELDFEIMGQRATVGSMLAILALHKDTHGGEIACLKGMQGLKGLPM